MKCFTPAMRMALASPNTAGSPGRAAGRALRLAGGDEHQSRHRGARRQAAEVGGAHPTVGEPQAAGRASGRVVLDLTGHVQDVARFELGEQLRAGHRAIVDDDLVLGPVADPRAEVRGLAQRLGQVAARVGDQRDLERARGNHAAWRRPATWRC